MAVAGLRGLGSAKIRPTEQCYARTGVTVRAAVSGGESRDAGGDGYGGNATTPFCGVGAVMSICSGTCTLERTGEAIVSSARALDTAELSSAGGQSYAGGGRL